MPTVIVVAGDVGTGKTTSLFPNPDKGIKGLPPQDMLYLSLAGAGKELAIKGWKRIFQADKSIQEGGRYKATHDPDMIRAIIRHVDKTPDIKYLVIDDTDYVMGKAVVSEDQKMDFEDWRKLAVNMFSKVLSPALDSLTREDLVVIFLWHSEYDKQGNLKLKTSGAMLDTYIKLDGLFSHVLYTRVLTDPMTGRPKYQFVTNRIGDIPAKTLPGCFDELYIPNDMGIVVDAILEYQK